MHSRKLHKRRQHKSKRSYKRSSKKIGKKLSKKMSKRIGKKMGKKAEEHVTYVPSNNKFVLAQNISSHQRTIFLNNVINPSLQPFASSNKGIESVIGGGCTKSVCSGK